MWASAGMRTLFGQVARTLGIEAYLCHKEIQQRPPRRPLLRQPSAAPFDSRSSDMGYSKGTKKGKAVVKPTAPRPPPPLRSKLPDQQEHEEMLDKARSEKDREQIKRMRDVLSASRKRQIG
jgi:hypothetical protein